MKNSTLSILFLFLCSFASAQLDSIVSIKVYSANMYCGEERLTEGQVIEHRNKQAYPEKTYFSINLSKQASGEIEIIKWTSNEDALVKGQIETGEYLILDEEDFASIVTDVPTDEKFVITGAYLRSLARKGSARLYVPREVTNELEVIFWKDCDE